MKRLFLIIFTIGLMVVVMACLMTYIVQLQKRLRLQIYEYFNLINRMREGVLVLIRDKVSAKTKEIKFYNKSS